jgi:oligoendopeptidase F
MTDAVKEHTTGADEVVWDLSIFYASPDDPAIQHDMDAVSAQAQAFASKYRGSVAALDAEAMVDALVEREALLDRQGRISAYTFLNFSTDTADPARGALLARVQEFNAIIQQQIMFFDLEWKAAPDDTTRALLANPTLGKYAHLLEADLRLRPHILSEEKESLLVEKSVTGEAAWGRLFTQLISSLRFEWEGEQLTLPLMLDKLYSADRDVRRRAAAIVSEGLRARSMETTFIFNVILQDKAMDDKRRHFASWVSARNIDNKAPDAVVDALVDAVTANYEIVARHYRLKRALLGVDELTEYDRYAPFLTDVPVTYYTWDEARAVVSKAYHAFSPQAGAVIDRFFDEHWIHAALLPNKRGGAFSSAAVPSAHPFILMNYTGKPREVMTLAHELGHGLHQYLAGNAQGIYFQYTPLTTAETASVFGEMLTFQDMLRSESDPKARLMMLAQKIEDSFATVFRQVAMNRFEHAIHTARREQGELSTERICALWLETQRAMFKDSVSLSDHYGIWWSYVSHFIGSPGYVYAYAFGELLVLALYRLYQARGESFVPQYLDLLKAGDTDYPDKLLAKIGIDLNDPGFWNGGLQILSDLVSEEEALAREIYPEKFAQQLG